MREELRDRGARHGLRADPSTAARLAVSSLQMSAHRHTLSDPKAAAEACAHHVITCWRRCCPGRSSRRLAVSGGSSPKLLFDRLAATQFRWDMVHIFWVDERCVPPTDEQSNYKMANEHLIRPGAHPAAQRTPDLRRNCRPPARLDPVRRRYPRVLRPGAGQLPRFDVVHLGMGPDAHTASLFPRRTADR